MNLEEIRRVTQQATPGPWEVGGASLGITGTGHYIYTKAPHTGIRIARARELDHRDAEFIALAREAIPWLLNELESRDSKLSLLLDRIDQLVEAGDALARSSAEHRCGACREVAASWKRAKEDTWREARAIAIGPVSAELEQDGKWRKR